MIPEDSDNRGRVISKHPSTKMYLYEYKMCGKDQATMY